MQQAIKKLLRSRNAIMLAHNYQPPEIQDLADMCGDSLELSIRAGDTDAEVIVFCGVHFMAETASIISPPKRVLLPRHDAGCLMADMIDADALAAKKASLPPMPVVTYVNSTAEVKALSTICCTSANVVKVVNSLPEREMLLAPDRNLAMYAASKTDKRIHVWDGYCPTHEWLTSTSGMLRYAHEADQRSFIVGTETGILHPMRKQNPDKVFYPASEKMVCRNMKRIGLADVAACLETMSGEVKVPEEIRVPALAAVRRMLDLSR